MNAREARRLLVGRLLALARMRSDVNVTLAQVLGGRRLGRLEAQDLEAVAALVASRHGGLVLLHERLADLRQAERRAAASWTRSAS